MRDSRIWLNDIHEAIERIERYSAHGRETFEQDELIQTWVIHHLQVIGEACRSLEPEFREQHAEIPWSQIIGMRHILVHRYFNIDVETVWAVVERDLPELKRQIAAILNTSGERQ